MVLPVTRWLIPPRDWHNHHAAELGNGAGHAVVEWFINHRVTDAVRKVLAVLCDRGAGNPVVEYQPPGDRHRSGMSAQARHRSGAEAAPKRQAAPAP